MRILRVRKTIDIFIIILLYFLLYFVYLVGTLVPLPGILIFFIIHGLGILDHGTIFSLV